MWERWAAERAPVAMGRVPVRRLASAPLSVDERDIGLTGAETAADFQWSTNAALETP